MSNKIIETEYYLLEKQVYEECLYWSKQIGVTIDYYLMEFTDIEYDIVEFDGENWIEGN